MKSQWIRAWTRRFLSWLLPPRPPVLLICMRVTDMHAFHPAMDVSRDCSECGRALAIYPSGQAIITKYGDRLKLVCQVCGQAVVADASPAPGAIEEVGQSVPIGRR